MKLSYYPIGVQLRLGFGVLLAALVAVAMLGLYQLNTANATLRQVVEINVKKLELLAGLANSAHEISRVVRTMALVADPEETKKLRSKVVEADADFEKNFNALRSLPLDSTGEDFVAKIDAQLRLVKAATWEYLNLANSDRAGSIEFLLKRVRPASVDMLDLLDRYMAVQLIKNQQGMLSAETQYSKAKVFTLSLTVTMFVGGCWLARLLAQSVSKSISEAVELAQTVESGNLARQIRVNPKNRSESGGLLRTLNQMSGALNLVVGKVRDSSHALQSHALDIDQGNHNLTGRTVQQASALEQSAAAMEELAASVKQNADNADEASNKANAALDIARYGGVAVERVVERMDAIDASSKQIVEIIAVINSIAFQTNILALNAAVEAARAGGQGRGFAVVASEVRALAQKSAAAADEIAKHINSSVSEVRAGTELARRAGATMAQVVESVNEVSSLITEIATATREQSVGIEQTYSAVSDLEQITQQNANLGLELGGTASALKAEALRLTSLVAHFELTEDDSQSFEHGSADASVAEPWGTYAAPYSGPRLLRPQIQAA